MVHVSSCMLWDTAIQSYHHALTELFNLSLKNAKFPDNWKISNKTLVFKSGDPSSVLNYRPISLLPLVSKILEGIIHSCLMNFLQTNRLLSSCQYGFRPCSSTQEGLLSVTNDWYLMLSKHRQVASIFFDVIKGIWLSSPWQANTISCSYCHLWSSCGPNTRRNRNIRCTLVV